MAPFVVQAPERKRVLLVCQAFPPLLKNAGGVAKRYLTLCGALIDDLDYDVTLVTPVNVLRAGDKNIERWIREGRLRFTPARGVTVATKDGDGVFLDVFSAANALWFWNILLQHETRYEVAIMDDVPWRASLVLQFRALGIPTVITSHTDATRLEQASSPAFKLAWWAHMQSARLADVHASVSRVFGGILAEREHCHCNGFWPPILWSGVFRESCAVFQDEAAAWRRACIRQLGFEPRCLMLSAGRWSKEKRVHMLFSTIPDKCALVVVGDGTSTYSEELVAAAEGHDDVLVLRGMLNAHQLRIAYQGSDLFLSASDFETLGNTIVEAITSGTPVAVQPAQGHLEHVVDGENSYFVDFDDQVAAREKLAWIVDEGLDPTALPGFEITSRRLRNVDFAREFDHNILETARACDRQRRERFAPLEWTLCLLALLAHVVFFVVMRVFTRSVYTFSKFPKFRVLGELGSSTEAPVTPGAKKEFKMARGKKSLRFGPRLAA